MPQRCVSVERLAPGLFVSRLDRPWVETPFMFQGFEIVSRKDIEALQAHCKYVWVDTDRSSVTVPGRNGSRPSPDQASVQLGEVRERFQRGYEAVHESRQVLLSTYAHVMKKLREERQLDTENLLPVIDAFRKQLDAWPEIGFWLLEMREHDDGLIQHSVNVCALALLLARYLEHDEAEIPAIGLGALLHDVGKVSMPRDALNRKPITSEDWKRLRHAPLFGHKLLAQHGLPDIVLSIVRNHQERLDGSGFPDGLAGAQIPLPTRLVGLVNAYDAMTEDRPGSPALSGYRAMRELSRHAGTRWGEKLVDSFVQMMGVYPPGTRVVLDNGKEGIVIHSQPDARLRPLIAIHRNGTQTELDTLIFTNLSTWNHPRRVMDAATPDGTHTDLLRRVSGHILTAD